MAEPDQIRVSDHALLRWCQRTGAINLEPLRQMLEASLDRAARAADSIGLLNYHIVADDLVYVVHLNVVTTVMQADGRKLDVALDPRHGK